MFKKHQFFSGLVFLLLMAVLVFPFPGSVSAKAGIKTMPVAKIEAGMEGYGRTVFSGTRIDTFSVKILGVLENVMPGQDMILIEAENDTLHHTNIMSGMSGSPIYIDGHLIGALAYGWSFGKDPIAGVTPIKNILKASRNTFSKPEGAKQISTPLVASGFSSIGLDSFADHLRRKGMAVEIMVGGSGKKAEVPPVFEAGSALGVQLVRGDLNLAAIGTVTHVDNEGRVYAFGHPFLNAGQINFPMTAASVETTLASLQSSFKIASPLQPVGAVTEDRQAAIVGQMGARAAMIPVNIGVSRPGEGFKERYKVEIINNRYLSPGLLNTVAFNFANRKLSQLGIDRVKTEIKLKLKDQPEVHYTTVVSSQQTFDPWSFMRIAQLWENKFEKINVQQVDVFIKAEQDDQRAKIRDVWLDRHRPRPGEKIKVYVELEPFRGSRKILSYDFIIPEGTSGSAIRINVQPAPRLITKTPRPENLKQLIEIINNVENKNNLAVVIEYPEPGLNVSGHRLEKLPESFVRSMFLAKKSDWEILPATIKKVDPTAWILSGGAQLIIPLGTR